MDLIGVMKYANYVGFIEIVVNVLWMVLVDATVIYPHDFTQSKP